MELLYILSEITKDATVDTAFTDVGKDTATCLFSAYAPHGTTFRWAVTFDGTADGFVDAMRDTCRDYFDPYTHARSSGSVDSRFGDILSDVRWMETELDHIVLRMQEAQERWEEGQS